MIKKHHNLIMKVITIKINLAFVIIFAGAMVYSAEMLGKAVLIKEMFFWITILLMIAFATFTPLKDILNSIEDLINMNKFAKGEQDE